ncbi:hypothetical protein [Helicobacter enhydrae]|uniref:hypothetical protein n=1 Tax=Helicobacter enhydrae TaxID=222136 RepID=UPI0018FF9B1D|nr:hypothetical protein [Helicobacter enhydrae]
MPRLQELDEIQKLRHSLPLELQKQIDFVCKKGTTLLFALKNPNYIPEFNTYKAKDILNALFPLKEHLSSLSQIQKVQGYIPHKRLHQDDQGSKYFKAPKNYAILSEQTEVLFLQPYVERANGDFINHSSNPKLFDLFEEIRATIIRNKHQ